MTYSSESHIMNVEDVKTFFHYLVSEKKLNFHPDDDFADYVNYKTNQASFNLQEVELYNRLMDESFSICESNEIDIYEIGLEELQNNVMKK